jgi:hypothetical protein
VDGQTLAERLLSANEDTASVRLASTSGPAGGGIHRPSFGEFLLLGTKHILIGYDHLLFLFSLLMVTRGWGMTFKLISSFTLAHSATLALATVGVIDLPGRVVEPLIAASIIYVGVENFIHGQAPKGRVWMTFAFGLIHGLGFASVLRDLGIASTSAGVFVPLVSFNLGVELGQLLVAALLLPLFWLVSQRQLWTKRWVPACSGLVTLAGSYWFVERLWL